MASDDATKMDALLAEIEAIDDKIGRETRLAQAGRRAGDRHAAESARWIRPSTATPRAQRRTARLPARRLQALDQAQLHGMRSRQNEDIRAAMNMPAVMGAMSTTTAGEGGCYRGHRVRPQRGAGDEGLRRHAAGGRLPHQHRRDDELPDQRPTAEVGEIVGQNAAVTGADDLRQHRPGRLQVQLEEDRAALRAWCRTP